MYNQETYLPQIVNLDNSHYINEHPHPNDNTELNEPTNQIITSSKIIWPTKKKT